MQLICEYSWKYIYVSSDSPNVSHRQLSVDELVSNWGFCAAVSEHVLSTNAVGYPSDLFVFLLFIWPYETCISRTKAYWVVCCVNIQGSV